LTRVLMAAPAGGAPARPRPGAPLADVILAKIDT
jgi:hypothetical protein